jgi:hypothetical protein
MFYIHASDDEHHIVGEVEVDVWEVRTKGMHEARQGHVLLHAAGIIVMHTHKISEDVEWTTKYSERYLTRGFGRQRNGILNRGICT